MKKKENIQSQVFQIFENVIGHNKFTISDSLTSNNISGYDSMAQINFISNLEKEFSIRFMLKELAKITTLESVIALVYEKLP